jgi:hypothetical protein
MKKKILKPKTQPKENSKKLIKPDSAGYIITFTIFLSTIFSVFAFSPTLLYVNPYVYVFSDRYISFDDLKLKSISSIQVIGSPRLGFNTLVVTWPIFSDCGPIYLEIIQYEIFRKEIYIWIWSQSAICPQVAALEEYSIDLFIPSLGLWQIFCNEKSIIIAI